MSSSPKQPAERDQTTARKSKSFFHQLFFLDRTKKSYIIDKLSIGPRGLGDNPQEVRDFTLRKPALGFSVQPGGKAL
jgi:hypothetical protein